MTTKPRKRLYKSLLTGVDKRVKPPRHVTARRAQDRAEERRAKADRIAKEATRIRMDRDKAVAANRKKFFFKGAMVKFTPHAIAYFGITDTRTKRILRMESDGFVAVLNNHEKWLIYHLEPT